MPPVTITLVPHTHWDREWYQPFEVFRERLVAMMDTLIELGEAGFPHFHLDGQTAMVDDYLAVRPEREDAIRRLVRARRLSLGPWFTQMDEFLTSGESHIRNLERGLARARELGRALEVGYMPDQFGHIGQMPQLLAMHGIERAIVWRGVPAQIDRTSFRWTAPDGTSVFTEYLAFGYFNGEAYREVADPLELASAIRDSVDRAGPFLSSDRLLVMVGADHAGPDASLPSRLEAAASSLDGATVRIAGLEDHLDGPAPASLPTWRGELRSSARAHLLPNVVSARVHQKRERGRVEALVERYAEPLAALVPGYRWPAERFDRAWQLLLWNGAHDSACGCSHDQVARDVDARFAEARSICEAIVRDALGALASRSSAAGVLRFNPSPFVREGVPGLGWRVDADPPGAAEGTVDLVQRNGWVGADGLWFTFRDEPDVGDLYDWCYAREDQTPEPPDEIRLDGQSVRARFDGSEVTTRVVRRAGEPFVRLEGVIENSRPDHRLRLHVRIARGTRTSLAGAPFELVRRPRTSEGSSLEAASPTWPARGVVLAGGVAACHEAVFEYEVAADELAITLLRAVGTISRGRIATRPWAAGPDVPTPDAQAIGSTGFALALRPGARRRTLLRDWERFALPLASARAGGGGDLPPSGQLLTVRTDAELSNVRRRDGAIEVRLWNPRPSRSASARLGDRLVALRPCAIETLSVP